MFFHAEEVSPGATIDADICVIGSGAAGISFAREFLGSSTRVCVLESGQVQTRFNQGLVGAFRIIHRTLNRFCTPEVRDAIVKSIVSHFAHDALYDFEYTDLSIGHQSRRRSFGGSMIAWGGKWVRLEKIDFIKRPWVPHSGWPITRDELDPYYIRASKSVHAPDPTNAVPSENFLGKGVFETLVFHVQKKSVRNWGHSLRSDFKRSQNISVYTGAHVASINKEDSHIETVSAHTSRGSSFSVHAHYFVLAGGGIENPRTLLISNIGNEHDQVGRYYMDHPMGRAGTIETDHPIDLSRYWGADDTVVGFRLADAVQEKESILNDHVFLESLLYEPTLFGKIKRKLFRNKASMRIGIRNHLEQVPVAENRITLSDAKDPFDLPKAKISWSLTQMDKKTIVLFHQYLQERVKEAGIGELHSPLLGNDPSFSTVLKDAAHHMGTTRMGEDPMTSVVDKNCKVHALDNMFIAGSSVFPTSGSANPTATICALAVRLADHIKSITPSR